MTDWHSESLSILYHVLGWFAFCAWSFSFYPQVVLNYHRKSVIGLNFDYVLLNVTKHSCYLIYNASMFFSPVVQRQYREKYGANEMIPVATNDVAFSIHAVLLTSIILIQIIIYDRGNQKLSKLGAFVSSGACLSGLICLTIAIHRGKWFWLVSVLNIIQLVITAIKYIPQVWMHFKRKSTEGWSIFNNLLDISGGVANVFQMAVQSIDQHSAENFSGNAGKVGISLECIAFDILFIAQHFFYPVAPSDPAKLIEPDIEASLLDEDSNVVQKKL